MNQVYEDRLKQIDIDMKKAILGKRWTEAARLKVERARVEKLIDKSQ
jgi:cytochrome c-type biogenesis protein CcmH/NrfG